MTGRILLGALTAALLMLPLGRRAAAAVKWDYYIFVGITHPIGQYAKEVKKRGEDGLQGPEARHVQAAAEDRKDPEVRPPRAGPGSSLSPGAAETPRLPGA